MKLLDLDIPSDKMTASDIDNLKYWYRSLSRKEFEQQKTIRKMYFKERELEKENDELKKKLIDAGLMKPVILTNNRSA